MNKAAFNALIATAILLSTACSSALTAMPAVETPPAPTLPSPTVEPPAPTPQPEPTAAPAPIPCTIAFDTDRDGNREVYTVSPDGKNTTNLTNNPADDSSPAWSPDGSALAFVSTRETKEENGQFIHVINIKTGLIRQLTHMNGSDWPDWSGDGKWITFTTGNDIFIIPADGSAEPTNLTNSPEKEYRSAFSPIAGKIAWIKDDKGHRNIFVMDLDSRQVEQITDNGRVDGFQWTADGRILTGWSWTDGQEFCHNCVVSADGEEIADAGGKGSLRGLVPFWTADGQAVELANIDLLDGNDEIYLFGEPFPDPRGMGIGQINLTNHPAADRNADWPALCGPGQAAAAAALATPQENRSKNPQEIVLGYAGDRPEDWQKKNNFQKACGELGIRCEVGDLPGLIEKGVDAVVYNAAGLQAANPAELSAAGGKSTPIVLLDGEVDIEGVYTVAVDPKARTEAGLEWMTQQMGGQGQIALYHIRPDRGEIDRAVELLAGYPGIKLLPIRSDPGGEFGLKTDVGDLVREYPDLKAIWSDGRMSEIVLGMAVAGIPAERWPLLPCEATKTGLYIWKDRLKDFSAMKCVAVSSPPGLAYDAVYAAFHLASGAEIDPSALGGEHGRTLFVPPVVVTNQTLLTELEKCEFESDDCVVDAWMDPDTIREKWFKK